MDLAVIAIVMKRYSMFQKPSGQESYNQIQFSFMLKTLVLFDTLVGPKRVLPFWVRVDQAIMEIKRYSIFH